VSKIKTIKSNDSWIIINDKDTDKIGSIVKTGENQYKIKFQGLNKFYTKSQLLKSFGKQLFSKRLQKQSKTTTFKILCDYPTDVDHYNGMYDVKRQVPVYTKDKKSKSYYCAGHYLIKLNKGWSEMFCPKAITIQKYKFYGPFVTSQKLKAFSKKFLTK
jgi:hypothetical protein